MQRGAETVAYHVGSGTSPTRPPAGEREPGRRRPEDEVRSGTWATPPGRWDANTPEALLSRAETATLIEQAIAALPVMQRAVVTLRDVGGWNADEVCGVLELSEVNQRVLLHRARSRLRAALERHLVGR
jgi:RNA polymerase sigma-70 factor (ECF subfamily)